MAGTPKAAKSRISPETQYREAYESWRQHDRFIWQLPSVIVVVDGIIIGSSFAFVNPWWAREFVIGFAFILTLILTFTLLKHRYFIDLSQNTLLELERKHAEKSIQRLTEPKKGIEYWHKEDKPTWLQKQSAHRFFRGGMYVICLLLLTLLILNCVMFNAVPLYAIVILWVAYSIIVFVAALFLWKNRAV